MFEKIAKGLKDHKTSGSNELIAYVMKEAWFAGFEEGRKHPLTFAEELAEDLKRRTEGGQGHF